MKLFSHGGSWLPGLWPGTEGLSDSRELSLWEPGLDTPKSHLTSANLSRKTGEYLEMAKVELKTPGSQRY